MWAYRRRALSRSLAILDMRTHGLRLGKSVGRRELCRGSAYLLKGAKGGGFVSDEI